MAEPVLYVIATPIGNLGDLSARAVSLLGEVDLIAAEDTRHTGRLLAYFNIKSTLISVHDHNEVARAEMIIDQLSQGKRVALVSDAGTPLISDPGYALVRRVREAGYQVSPVPGCCAFVAALSAAGLPSDRFMFIGFLPARRQARLKSLEELVGQSCTLVFYESTHRILDSLQDMIEVFGPAREAVVARELTKTFETFRQGALAELLAWMQADSNQQKGEFVVLVRGAEPVVPDDESVDPRSEAVLRLLADELPPKKAAALAAQITGVHKKRLYELLLQRS
ncbi:rRNA small subunit methyltransferase I [Nitrincola lacisaponensis]|uniref:Ribosomal RNA small subunit methyltransferase I n=1 Tax=Nitrincola lacisaponensis TaxID=267850 RepID=A0A063Y5I6_9GAMM|nr:16S rRNA (cytidine(1402)-2'-O)-methyltransferase [Nitrincola lacisaponensis]KDE40934.1 rRNA small subunit methyltransferase I [Nitrincola lacisaponensis]